MKIIAEILRFRLLFVFLHHIINGHTPRIHHQHLVSGRGTSGTAVQRLYKRLKNKRFYVLFEKERGIIVCFRRKGRGIANCFFRKVISIIKLFKSDMRIIL